MGGSVATPHVAKSVSVSSPRVEIGLQMGQYVEVWEKLDALLFVWIRSRHQPARLFRLARVDWQVGNIRWDVQEVAGSHFHTFGEILTEPHDDPPLEDIDGGLVAAVTVRQRSSPRRDDQ